MSSLFEAFSELGVTKTEGRILESLIADGPATGSAVATRLGIHKSVAYFVLEQLAQKGLASFVVINKRREYRSIDLKLLKMKLDERRKLFSKNFDHIQALMQLAQKEKKGANFNIFKGWDGMKIAFNDILSAKPEDYFVFAVDVPEKILPRFRRFIRQFQRKRSEMEIECKILVSSRLRSTIGADRKKERNTSVRFVSSKYSMPMASNVYANKVLLAIWTDPPLAIIIESKEVSDSFKAFFHLIWRIGRP